MKNAFLLTMVLELSSICLAQTPTTPTIYQDCSKNGTVVNFATSGTENGHEWVDLGLPSGIKWATCNIGANKPNGYGNYYAWGETKTKSRYSETSTYIDSPEYLPLSADAAYVNWGKNWHIPTYSDFNELYCQCTWQWTNKGGTNGYIVTGQNGNAIFVPAAGYYQYSSLTYGGERGQYWSSKRYEEGIYKSAEWGLYFTKDIYGLYYFDRAYGLPIRPVCSNPSEGLRTITLYANSCSTSSKFIHQDKSMIAITAVPQDCQQFVRWSDGNIDNPRTITLTSDTTFTAEFAPKQYTISANATNGTIIGGGKYDCNATATLTATPNKYYHFVKWSDGDTDNPRAITVTKDSTFEAEFRLDAAGDIEYVDLGLSVVWATCNLGATSPEGYGEYYAWGETSTKSVYDWETYIHCNKSQTKLTKYCNNSNVGNNGFIDNKNILEKSDDAAHTSLGYAWRMPTKSEWDELISNCSWTWTKQNDVQGYLVTNTKNGKSIFIPAAGSYSAGNSTLYNATTNGHYWSSTCVSGSCYMAHHLNYNVGKIYNDTGTRRQGMPIRAVCPTNVELFNISTFATNGSVTGSGTYQQGATATLTATNSDCYSFQKWSDGVTDNPRQVVVTQDSTFTAIFVGTGYQETVKCTVVNESPYGTVSFTGTVIKDSNISLQATAPECSKFVRWSDNDTSNPRNLTVTQDSTLTAIFEKIQFKVSVETDDDKKGEVDVKGKNTTP